MEKLHKLLFELSSAERISIMLELQKSKLKLSHLSRKIDLTVTETSRHLQRLIDAKLVQKEAEGTYELTQFGWLALFLLDDLDFVFRNRDFFLEYDVSGIPKQLIYRLGELERGTYVDESLRNLEEGEKKISQAQEFVWILSNDVLGYAIQPLMDKVNEHFDLRIVLPKGKFPPESVSRLPLRTGIQKRVLPKVNIVVVLTDSYAVFCLPNRSGKIDYTGFQGKDTEFCKWCKDLFLHYWEMAKPINKEQG